MRMERFSFPIYRLESFIDVETINVYLWLLRKDFALERLLQPRLSVSLNYVQEAEFIVVWFE